MLNTNHMHYFAHDFHPIAKLFNMYHWLSIGNGYYVHKVGCQKIHCKWVNQCKYESLQYGWHKFTIPCCEKLWQPPLYSWDVLHVSSMWSDIPPGIEEK